MEVHEIMLVSVNHFENAMCFALSMKDGSGYKQLIIDVSCRNFQW